MKINPNLYSKVLFDGSTTENIILNDNANNYKYLVFVAENQLVSILKVTDNMAVSFIAADLQPFENPGIVICGMYYENSGTILKYINSARWYRYVNNNDVADKGIIHITKVIGIK